MTETWCFTNSTKEHVAIFNPATMYVRQFRLSTAKERKDYKAFVIYRPVGSGERKPVP
jgi:hypothetical protein